MRKLFVALCALPFAAFSASALADAHGAGAAKAEACLDCHMEDDFAGMSVEEIAELIKGARDPDFGHPPEITELAEEDIPTVAAYFAHEGAR